eukprot:CAMPEP_0115300784 /NCGR_PEP_ID=MMETSP0270-20121206/69513_1 /TAXON_ID=71861 /ORGANISM="Scrippsiella trochoidea, Strain CCMP3099" /LENGTH=525 /DNA_ID=CAMNT_0002718625 /DNA_START=78 /DNA_END=1655 /DNA_ORIENTATION=+
MADVAQGEGMSKSAKRRAAKKARDSAAAEVAAPEPEPPAPEPKAKAKAKGKAKAEPAPAPAPEPKAEPKAKAKGKAKAKAEPEPPAPAPAAPKAKAKGKAKAEPEPPAPAAPKAKAKAAAKAEAAPAPAAPAAPKAASKQGAQKPKAKAAAKVEEEEKPKVEEKELLANYVIDDGSGPAWEVNTGVTKKQQRRKERQSELKAVPTGAGGKSIPGMVPTNTVPGMAPAGAKGGGKGVSQSVAADVERILAMKGAGAVVEEKPAEGNTSSVSINVPEKSIGIVIGPKGAKIKMIQEKTQVTRIDTTGNLFTIMGPPQAVAQAETAIKELIEKGYCALQYDDFSENYVNVHPSYFPDLIGKQGAVVRKIKDELGVEINFPETQKNAPASKKYKVGLAGSTQAVEKAKNVINNIMMYSHDELTHPGEVHEELEIEAWAWRYIIGTAGSEMKHIQNNYKVKVCIPRDHSLNQKVLVVGEPSPVERAKVYIEKLVWNAEHKTSGRDKVDDGDAWGDEEPEEEWMKQYLYKR